MILGIYIIACIIFMVWYHSDISNGFMKITGSINNTVIALLFVIFLNPIALIFWLFIVGVILVHHYTFSLHTYKL